MKLLSHTLRESTRPSHDALERTAGMRHLMGPGFSLGRYALLLKLWCQHWGPLEQAVQTHRPPCVPLLYRPQNRVARLEADLQVLAPWQPEQADAEPPPSFDACGARWYGLAYVLQGSMLGSSVIAAHLRHTEVGRLHAEQGGGLGFFAFEEPADMPLALRWRQWLSWLDLSVTQADDQALATQAATEAFSAITHTLRAHETNFERLG